MKTFNEQHQNVTRIFSHPLVTHITFLLVKYKHKFQSIKATCSFIIFVPFIILFIE